jgi:predicted transcriptional regulator
MKIYVGKRNDIMTDALRVIKISEVNKTNLVKDFLLEMLLTEQWSARFLNMLIEDDKERWSNHIADYIFGLGYVEKSNKIDYKYQISSKGRKYLEQHGRYGSIAE